MIRLFTGFDKREARGWHTFVASLIEQSGDRIALHWLSGEQKDGTNAFTYERFSIMERCSWSGWAIFVDGADMILRAPIEELYRLRDPTFAVQVVKHDYITKHPRKYVGTDMEADNRDYPRKNWSSVMLVNCAHLSHFKAREHIRAGAGSYLHRFGWLQDQEIGELPKEWGWLADEYGPNPQAKLLHWTAGYPGFAHYANAPMAEHWHEAAKTLHSER